MASTGTDGLTITLGVCEHGPVLNLACLLQLHSRIRIITGNGRNYVLVKTPKGLQLMVEVPSAPSR